MQSEEAPGNDRAARVSRRAVCRVVGAAVIAVTSITIAARSARGQSAAPWPMVQHDSARSGRSPYSTSTNTGGISWKFSAQYSACLAPVIAADRTIYASCDGLLALRPDGTVKWSYTIDAEDPPSGLMGSQPAVASDGSIYFVSSIFHPERVNPNPRGPDIQRDDFLWAVSPNGKLKWKLPIRRDGGNPVIGENGTIYISGSTFVYAVDAGGKVKWKFAPPGMIDSDPAIGPDGTVYVGSYDDGIYALDPKGTPNWNFATHDVRSTPAVGFDGTIYVSCSNHNLYALDRHGTLKWEFATGGAIVPSPAIGADGSIYAISLDQHLYVLKQDGKLQAKLATGKYFDRALGVVVSADGVIYVSGILGSAYKARHYLVAFAPDGRLKWKFSAGPYNVSTPAIGADGTVYAGTSDGHIYAFGPAKTMNRTP